MKIMAVCGQGLGSSFMVEMNIKKVLKKLNVDAEVTHADLASVAADQADIFVMTKDLASSSGLPADKLVVLSNIIDINDLESKLVEHFAKS
jgi:ascorbate PTS system EIIB component